MKITKTGETRLSPNSDEILFNSFTVDDGCDVVIMVAVFWGHRQFWDDLQRWRRRLQQRASFCFHIDKLFLSQTRAGEVVPAAVEAFSRPGREEADKPENESEIKTHVQLN